MIKVIDIFAGPGGLSEGFSSLNDKSGSKIFDIVLSIEKEKNAFDTLKLRTFLRQFRNSFPPEYYSFLEGKQLLDELYAAYPSEYEEAEKRCWNQELGFDLKTVSDTRDLVRNALSGDENFILIGGPPCQAYSLAGRSRNSGNPDYDETTDKRHTLYIEYLQLLADHKPIVFIMENVKGLLSAKYQEKKIFRRILDDLSSPNRALQREKRAYYDRGEVDYNVYSLVDGTLLDGSNPRNAVVKSENYGIPQARHRVILLGIRNDLHNLRPNPLVPHHRPIVLSEVISDLPKIRGGLSKEHDDQISWLNALKSQIDSQWIKQRNRELDSSLLESLMIDTLNQMEVPENDRGGKSIPVISKPLYREDWYFDQNMKMTKDHYSRSHMRMDLYRYFFASCFADVYKRSPILSDFPQDLLPDHSNVSLAITEKGHFSDRFRVQMYWRPSTTIVSHISKDGHYYIHPDPTQCRSLTLREAARIQTFPDNYHFCGNRTSQFTQVGNAVPPLLANQIGNVVANLMVGTSLFPNLIQ